MASGFCRRVCGVCEGEIARSAPLGSVSSLPSAQLRIGSRDPSPQAVLMEQSHRLRFQTTSAAAYGSLLSQGRRGERVCVRILATQFAPELYNLVAPLLKRGRRECRVHAAPAVSCAKNCALWRTRAYRFSGNTPASPAQWLYGLLRALPGGAGLLSPSPADHSTELDASIAAPGPHDFAVRSRTIRL